MLKLYIFTLAISLASSEKFRFDNYTLYKINPTSPYEIKLLEDLRNSDVKYDFWNEISSVVGYVNVMTSPDTNSTLEAFLKMHGLKYQISMKNVQE